MTRRTASARPWRELKNTEGRSYWLRAAVCLDYVVVRCGEGGWYITGAISTDRRYTTADLAAQAAERALLRELDKAARKIRAIRRK